ncbi:hypothetical protein PLESTB_000363100 [Pleodorina starrii]|uniref:YdbS-like PH domain-containing protein n=1 Tax=Pleodorina starrii TaxID=330485 RepID=A0A9W6BEF6_9CHLO|nr:hypothetical protein PLESTM_000032100 [Pleodorina starrii]GLC50290.1 hypothetical protein PLESTB_000363100 [Pleodorina starrii]GLC64326.1 hypothetical protein PLESTF_000149500 [Pleodorina starrii]
MLGSMQAYHVRPRATLRPTTCASSKLCIPHIRSYSRTYQLRSPSERVLTKASTEDSTAAPAPAPPVETASASASASASTSGAADSTPEVVFYEGPGSNAELVLSLVLLPTLFYAPLSIASIGRRLWISFKFTNKRLVINNTSPLFKRTIEIAYKNIKEVRTGPRGFGLWGDMVVFLRDGSRIELTGLDKYKEIEEHINRCIYTL